MTCAIEDEETLKRYASDILNGIRLLHENAIVHCDIKPENLLATEENGEIRIKIGDLGFAMILAETDVFMSDIRIGSYGYISPEILSENTYTQKLDIWSFGITLYQMAVAYLPTVLDKTFVKKGEVPFRKQDFKFFDPAL